MSKELVITTKLKVDILDLVDDPVEWVKLSAEEQAEIASNYFDENPCEGWSFYVTGDWSEEEEKKIEEYKDSLKEAR